MEPTTRQIWEEGVKRQRDYRAQLEAAAAKALKARNYEIAAKMKELGLSLEIISATTSLTKKEILAL